MPFNKRLLIAIDQLVNVLLFNGWPDETVSACAWRQRDNPIWGRIRWALDKVFFWQVEHCYNSYLWEVTRQDLPVDYIPTKPD